SPRNLLNDSFAWLAAIPFFRLQARSSSGTDTVQQAKNSCTENNSTVCSKALMGSSIERITSVTVVFYFVDPIALGQLLDRKGFHWLDERKSVSGVWLHDNDIA